MAWENYTDLIGCPIYKGEYSFDTPMGYHVLIDFPRDPDVQVPWAVVVTAPDGSEYAAWRGSIGSLGYRVNYEDPKIKFSVTFSRSRGGAATYSTGELRCHQFASTGEGWLVVHVSNFELNEVTAPVDVNITAPSSGSTISGKTNVKVDVDLKGQSYQILFVHLYKGHPEYVVSSSFGAPLIYHDPAGVQGGLVAGWNYSITPVSQGESSLELIFSVIEPGEYQMVAGVWNSDDDWVISPWIKVKVEGVEPEWVFIETHDGYDIYNFSGTSLYSVADYAFYSDTSLADIRNQIDTLTVTPAVWATVLEWCPGLDGRYPNRVVDSGGAIGPPGAEYTYLCPPVAPLGEAKIYLNGILKGTTTRGILVISGVTTGNYVVCARASGFQDTCESLNVPTQISKNISMVRQ